jgi:Protein of unknown function (DUF1593)
MANFFRFISIATGILFGSSASLFVLADDHQVNDKNQRMIVLTDIEADPDDTQTLVRLMLYSNQIDIKGLIATTSVHQKNRIAPESIQKVIQAYGKVRKNLVQHETGFPTEKFLQNLVKSGSPVYGMQGVGDGKDTEGSDWIIKTLEENDTRPLWISIWGGANTLAQALHKIKATKTETELAKLISKLRVYTISDQDDSGFWIRKNFPNLFYIVSPGGYGAATWVGIHQVVEGMDNSSIGNSWLANNIQQDHGPLGAVYPDVAYGMEGDTPSWLNLIKNGLNSPENPAWGGWGGRYELYIPNRNNTDPLGFTGGVPIEQEIRSIWTNAIDKFSPAVAMDFGRATRKSEKSFQDYRTTIWRWRDDFQADFAARMDWTINNVDDANHPPVVKLVNEEIPQVKSGQYFSLDAAASTDPDGDSLSYYWFAYPEASGFSGEVKIDAENWSRANILVSKVTKEQTLHMIVRVTDKGSPALSRYQRIVLTVSP